MVRSSKPFDSQLPVAVGPCESLEELHELARHEHPFLDLRCLEVMLSDDRDAPIVWLASHPKVEGVVLVIDSKPHETLSPQNLPGLCQINFCIVFKSAEAAKTTLTADGLPTDASFDQGSQWFSIKYFWETPKPTQNENFGLALSALTLDDAPDLPLIAAYLAGLALFSEE